MGFPIPLLNQRNKGIPGYITANARAMACIKGGALTSTHMLDQHPKHNGTRRTGEEGRCYTADGTDDEVNYGDIGSAIWFSGWVKLNSDDQCLFSLSNDTNTNLIVSSGVLTAGATLTLAGVKVDNVTKTASEAGALLNDNLWHFLSCGIGDGLGGASTADDVRYFTDGTNHGSVSGFDWRFWSTAPTAAELTEAYSGATANRNSASLSKYALWSKMDEQSGTASYDSSGNDLTGTITNATLATFHATQDIWSFQNQVGYNKRMYFDGINDYIDLGTLSSLGLESGGAVQAFDIRFNALVLNNTRVRFFGDADLNGGIIIGTATTNVILVGFYTNGSNRIVAAGSTQFPINTLVSVRVTHDGTETLNGIKVYINNIEESLSSLSSGVYTGISTTSCLLGRWDAGGASYLKGILYDIQIDSGWTGTFNHSYQGYGNNNSDWIDQIGSNDGIVYGSPSSAYLPRDESDLISDVLGNPLTYTGQRPNDFKLTGSNCLTSDGTLYITAAHLVGTETVVSSGGTSTPSISAGRIDFTAGTCWDLTLSDGTHYPLSEGWGVDIGSSTSDNDGTLTNAVLANAWGATQDEYHYNIFNGFSLYEHASTAAIRWPFKNGAVKTLTPPSGYSKTSDNYAGDYHNDAETTVDFDPDSTPEMTNIYSESVFNGSTSNGYVANDSVLNFTDNLTVTCWAKSDLTDITSSADTLVSMYEDTGNLETWRMEISTDEKLRFHVGNAGGTGSTIETADTAQPINDWIHYAATFDGGTVKLYINGELQGSSESSAHAATLNGRSAPLVLGAYFWSGGGGSFQEWDGSLKNIRVYKGDSAPLDNSQIVRDLMETETQPRFDGQTVIASYDLVKDTLDRSGNGLNATNNNILFNKIFAPSAHEFGDAFAASDQIFSRQRTKTEDRFLVFPNAQIGSALANIQKYTQP